jgi:hypothetical protein
MQKRPLHQHFWQGRADASGRWRVSRDHDSHFQDWEDIFWKSMDCDDGAAWHTTGPESTWGAHRAASEGGASAEDSDKWHTDWAWRVHNDHAPHARHHSGFWRPNEGASASDGARERSAGCPSPGRRQGRELSIEVRQHLASLDLQALPPTLQALKAAYQEAAKRYHPDMVSSSTACPQRFQGVTRAFHFFKERLSQGRKEGETAGMATNASAM